MIYSLQKRQDPVNKVTDLDDWSSHFYQSISMSEMSLFLI